MKKSLFLKFFLFLNGILLILTTCPSYPPFPTTSIPKTNPLVLTSATTGMSQVTSSEKHISITFTMQIDQECPAGANWNVLTLTVTPEGETEKEVLKMYLSCDEKKLYWGSDLMDYESQLNYAPYQTYKTFSAVVTVDLARGLVWMESNTGNGDEYGSYVEPFSGDPSSWSFDKTTKVYLCSGKDGAASAVVCTISRLQVSSSLTTILGNLADFTPASKAFYLLNGGPSTDLLSTITPASSGYFGDSPSSPTAGTSPSWDSSNSFVKITSQTQFITFPLPSITQDPVLVTTMSVAMWIRVSSVPTSSPATVFSLLYADGRTAYSITIDPSNFGLSTYFKGSRMPEAKNILGLTQNTWQLLTFTLYSAPNENNYARARIFVDDTTTLMQKWDPTGEFLSVTELRIGDSANSFLGDVSAVRILSPGIGNLTSSDLCDPDSAIQIGFGPYSLSCSGSGLFNPYNNMCYDTCPVDIVTLGTGAPYFPLCLTEPTEGGITVEESGGLSGGAIVGIVLGSLFALLFLIIVGYLMKKECFVKGGAKRRKIEDNEMAKQNQSPKTSKIVSPTNEEAVAIAL